MPRPRKSPRKRPPTPQAIKKQKTIAKAIEYHNLGWAFVDIGKELGYSAGTVSSWVKKHKAEQGLADDEKVGVEVSDPLGEAIKRDLGIETDNLNELAKDDARDLELELLEQRAANATTPEEKYQSWMVTTLIRKLRDTVNSINPKSAQDLERIDGIISKHMGLNRKDGGNSGARLHIDIGVLNNRNADLGGGSVKAVEGVKVQISQQERLSGDFLKTDDLLGEIIDANVEEVQALESSETGDGINRN
tara:strand:+ start:440 stop:1183 length:744 start_codon:yes stop_codon:yes gene_type:complete